MSKLENKINQLCHPVDLFYIFAYNLIDMKCKKYAHRYADIILNSEYTIKNEIDGILDQLNFSNIELKFDEINREKENIGKKIQKGRQPAINALLKDLFLEKG